MPTTLLLAVEFINDFLIKASTQSMSTISHAQYAKRKQELAAIRTEAKLKRIRCGIMRVNSLLMRAQSQNLRDRCQNLRAITQEWFIK